MERTHRGRPIDINREILQEWMGGRVRLLTWNVLVEVLSILMYCQIASVQSNLTRVTKGELSAAVSHASVIINCIPPHPLSLSVVAAL